VHEDVFDSARSRVWITVQSHSDDWKYIYLIMPLIYGRWITVNWRICGAKAQSFKVLWFIIAQWLWIMYMFSGYVMVVEVFAFVVDMCG